MSSRSSCIPVTGRCVVMSSRDKAYEGRDAGWLLRWKCGRNRRLDTPARLRAEGPWADAVRRRPPDPRPAARPARPLPRGARADHGDQHRRGTGHPGVVAVLTAHDLPIKASGTGRMYEPLAKTEVVYAGQPVALVVAESEAAAEDGAERVEVELEPLTPVLDLEAATQPGAPLAKTTTSADRRDRRDRRRRAPISPTPTRRSPPPNSRRPIRTTSRPPQAFPTATPTPSSRPATSRSRPGSRRRGSTRPISSHRRRPPGSSPTANSSSAPQPRRRSPPGIRSPSSSDSGSSRSGCAARRSAARSAARS